MLKDQDRRSFLKAFGVGTAVVVGANGKPKVVEEPNPGPPVTMAGAPERYWRDSYDVVSDVLYDRVKVARNGLVGKYVPIQFFSDVESSSQKTYSDTNLYRNRFLCAPEMFLVKKIGVGFAPGTDPAICGAVIRRFALELWLNQKQYLRIPLSLAAYPAPSTGLPEAIHSLEIPILITSGHSFYTQLVGRGFGPGPHPKLDLMCLMHGQRARGVQ